MNARNMRTFDFNCYNRRLDAVCLPSFPTATRWPFNGRKGDTQDRVWQTEESVAEAESTVCA